MSDLRELYQETIVDHAKRPRNFRDVPDANRTAEGFNPLCGDRVVVHARVRDGHIEDIGFEGSGCAISTASASIMTEQLKSKTLEQAEETAQRFHTLVTSAHDSPAEAPELGKLAVFAGVREFPARIKCATLVWHCLEAALKGKQEVVSTE
jgi:nitrogen fixation NifU-like protein